MKEMEMERRRFLRAVPAAALAGLILTDGSRLAESATVLQVAGSSDDKFELFTAADLGEEIKAMDANPANKTLYQCSTCQLLLTVEKEKAAKEFEWHEHRDHVIQILEGSTTYELGGTPQNAHSPKPGEWLAPASEGAKTLELKKGDILVLQRGTPHRRTTKDRVVLTLTAPMST
jgi:mannose-6-phosphate isomerase-like protein (cupin superfamily)